MKRRNFIKISSLSFIAGLLSACPKDKNGNNIPVSDITLVARFFAGGVVSLGVLDEIVFILKEDNTVSLVNAQSVIRTSEKILDLVDKIKALILSGVFNNNQLDQLIQNILDLIVNLESGLVFKNPASAERFKAYIALLKYSIQSVSLVVKRLKPTNPPKSELLTNDAKRDLNTNFLTLDQTTRIIGASTVASIKIANVATSDVATAWKLAEDESKAIHAINATRLSK